MEPTIDRPAWKTLLAFAIIYFVWGSTFLAIRVGVHEVPPFLFAAMRFLVAGAVLAGWMLAKGERIPNGRQWGSVLLIALLIFVFDYGLLFWAEQRVPSGVAAVMMATIPVFMALSEIVFLGTQRLTVRLAFALLIGIGGVAVLMSHSLNLGGAAIDTTGHTKLVAQIIGALAPLGKLVTLANSGWTSTVEIKLADLMMNAKQWVGSIEGNAVPETVLHPFDRADV